MVVVRFHDVRAAAGALLEGIRNEAGERDTNCFGPTYSYQRSSRPSSPGNHNPGNNLHVSGLSHRVDSRDLENHFAAIGRVRDSHLYVAVFTNTANRSRRPKSCAIPIPMSHADSVS